MAEKSEIIYFPGSKKDYEEWKGYKCKIVGANASFCLSGDVGVAHHIACIYLDGELVTDEPEAKNIEALVNATIVRSGDGSEIWGLPITRKLSKRSKR